MAWGDYDRSLKLSPMSLPILVSVGRAEIALNRYDDAARFLKEVAGKTPEASFYYGVALASTSDHVAEAQAALRTAAKDPTYALAANVQLALLEAREQGIRRDCRCRQHCTRACRESEIAGRDWSAGSRATPPRRPHARRPNPAPILAAKRSRRRSSARRTPFQLRR